MNESSCEKNTEGAQVQFPFVGGSVTLRCDDIIYVVTDRHKNTFHTLARDYGIYRKLDDLEQELSGYGFVRAHQSYLVNMRYIEKISSYVMYLTTGEELSVPKSRYRNVKETFLTYQSKH